MTQSQSSPAGSANPGSHVGQSEHASKPGAAAATAAGGERPPSIYPDLEQFWADLAAAYAQEVKQLYDLGCRYLQLDDTSLAYMNDPAQRQHVADIGGDPEHQHEYYIANINRALAGRPADLAVTTHMCRGNNQSMWAAEGRARGDRRGNGHAGDGAVLVVSAHAGDFV